MLFIFILCSHTLAVCLFFTFAVFLEQQLPFPSLRSFVGCKTLGDYMRVYLLADVLLLTGVFDNFRSNCLRDYSLNPLHHFSSPHFTLDAFLRFTGVTLDLLSDVNMFLLVERGIRGSLNMVSKAMQHFLLHSDFRWLAPSELCFEYTLCLCQLRVSLAA